jgi:hypothetical protein
MVTYGCESWTIRHNEEDRLNAFEMEGLRQILGVLWIIDVNFYWPKGLGPPPPNFSGLGSGLAEPPHFLT